MVDWFSRRVLAWRVSITMEVAFCLEAVGEALTRHGKPEIFNTDQSLPRGLQSTDLIRAEGRGQPPRAGPGDHQR